MSSDNSPVSDKVLSSIASEEEKKSSYLPSPHKDLVSEEEVFSSPVSFLANTFSDEKLN